MVISYEEVGRFNKVVSKNCKYFPQEIIKITFFNAI